MRWTHVCPLLGIALFACATQEDDFPTPSSLTTGNENTGGSADVGGSTGTDVGGSSGGSVAGGSSGSFGTSGSSSSGSSTGGSFGTSGATSLGGSSGTAGGGAGGTGGKAEAGSAGSAGTSSGGSGGSAGNGGKNGGGAGGSSGGSGGKASGGAGGSGGTQCGTIPAKSAWKGSALRATDPVTNAFDGDNGTRFTTGMAQMGDEWIEIDFGKQVTFNEVSMLTPSDDYSRHYQLLISNKTKDTAATLLSEGAGMNGTTSVTLPQTHSGQFLTIRQTGKVTPNWWSIYEIGVACK